MEATPPSPSPTLCDRPCHPVTNRLVSPHGCALCHSWSGCPLGETSLAKASAPSLGHVADNPAPSAPSPGLPHTARVKSCSSSGRSRCQPAHPAAGPWGCLSHTFPQREDGAWDPLGAPAVLGELLLLLSVQCSGPGRASAGSGSGRAVPAAPSPLFLF